MPMCNNAFYAIRMFSRIFKQFRSPSIRRYSLYSMALPVVVGHRGFKNNYPENTIQGFHECYKTGATIIETDLWVSKDEVLVVSHDGSTNRIFCDEDGNATDYNILETSYADVLQYLRVINSDEHLITFRQLLTWFVEYVETEEIGSPKKIMLDLKPVNPAKLMKFIIKDLLFVKNDIKWWYNRIQFGIWKLDYVKYLNQDEYFQTVFGEPNDQGKTQFDILNISFSWKLSLEFLRYNKYLDALDNKNYKIKTTGVSLIYLTTWSPEFVTKFLPIIKLEKLKFYTWTINFRPQFDYFVKLATVGQVEEYGVISDMPDVMEKFKAELQVYDEKDNLLDSLTLTWSQRFSYFLFSRFMGNPIPGQEDFESVIDENKLVILKPRPLMRWIFQKLQHFGIL